MREKYVAYTDVMFLVGQAWRAAGDRERAETAFTASGRQPGPEREEPARAEGERRRGEIVRSAASGEIVRSAVSAVSAASVQSAVIVRRGQIVRSAASAVSVPTRRGAPGAWPSARRCRS